MKSKLYLYILLSMMASSLRAQCSLDRHDTSEQSAWESCTTSANPNAARGTGHWIMYDFANNYDLGQMHFWNYNYPGETDKGIQNIIIDYAVNTNNWQGGIQHTVSEANGSSFYEGEAGPQLDGVTARYLLITVIDNHGDNCIGMSEMRVGIYQNPCNDLVLDINGIPVINGLYHAEQVLNSEGLVNATSEVFYQSENEIHLEPGFEARQGAVFEASIENCPD